MQATSNVIDQEKMAVILQEVVGNQYGDRYYPSMSGVARSLNYYLSETKKAEGGYCQPGTQAGKYIVDGGMTLRFSPITPTKFCKPAKWRLRSKANTFFASTCVTPDMLLH